MSTNQLRAAAGGGAAATTATEPKTIMGLLADEKVKKQMALALPSHMTADRLMRIAMTEVRKVPKLAQCEITSFMGAIMQCAQLGLEPGAALGHAYLLPFDVNKKQGSQWVKVRTDCQLIIGYRGMIDLARRSGQIISLSARSVHANDAFSYEFGLEETLYHKPADGDRGDLTHVYAVAKLVGGGVQFEVMSKADVFKIKETSKAKNSGPWVTNFDEMAKKTVIRRLFKYLPVSIEITRAVVLDEKADAGIDQDNASVLTGNYAVIPEEQQMLGADESLDEGTGEIQQREEFTRPEEGEQQLRQTRQRTQKPNPALDPKPEPEVDQELGAEDDEGHDVSDLNLE